MCHTIGIGGIAMRTIGVIGVVTAGLALSACERLELDRKMEELCEKDAGVKVYEEVRLTAAEYQKLVMFRSAKSDEDFYGPAYRYVSQREILIGTDEGATRGEGRIFRSYSAIYRRSDNRLLGESVNYFRTGGDGFTGGSHPSSASCGSTKVPSLGQSVLIKAD